jgi:periplasmic protein TonB
MRDPLSRLFSSLSPSQDSLLHRIRENFRQLLTPARIFPSSANGAPIHLPRWERSSLSGRAQSASFLTHVAIMAALVLLAFPWRHQMPPTLPTGVKIRGHIPVPKDLWDSLTRDHPSDGQGSGGGRTPIPTTAGNLLPSSSIQIVRPSLPPRHESVLPIPPTILDPNAAPVLTSVGKIGLPWMHDDTNSPGPGDSNTIGNGPGHTMGDGPIDGPGGESDTSLRYRSGVTQARCAYCPDPQYTDEAREAKVQGRVTIRVLVSAEGRAAQIRVIQGIGFGLDERAAEAVRSWKFIPARDAGRRAVPTWVTIEAFFRLF